MKSGESTAQASLLGVERNGNQSSKRLGIYFLFSLIIFILIGVFCYAETLRYKRESASNPNSDELEACEFNNRKLAEKMKNSFTCEHLQASLEQCHVSTSMLINQSERLKKEINSLQETIDKQQAMITSQNTKVATLEKEKNSLQTTIQNQQELLASQSQRLVGLEKTKGTDQSIKQDQQQTINKLNARISALEAEKSTDRSASQDQQRTIGKLNARILELEAEKKALQSATPKQQVRIDSPKEEKAPREIKCLHGGKTHSNGEIWDEKGAFRMHCEVDANGGWKTSILGCVVKGSLVNAGTKKQIEDTIYTCAKEPNGHVRLSQEVSPTAACVDKQGVKHSVGTTWVYSSFRMTCLPHGETKYLGCVTSSGQTLGINTTKKINQIEHHCVSNTEGSIRYYTGPKQ